MLNRSEALPRGTSDRVRRALTRRDMQSSEASHVLLFDIHPCLSARHASDRTVCNAHLQQCRDSLRVVISRESMKQSPRHWRPALASATDAKEVGERSAG
eukprot:763612-Hanusia_phi.AAC.12